MTGFAFIVCSFRGLFGDDLDSVVRNSTVL